MIKNHLKNQKGLTLIELLAVIVILGIIAAIAVPAIGNVISKTQEKAKYSEAQQIIDSARLYITAETPLSEGSDLTLTQATPEFKPYYDKVDEEFTLSVSKDSNGKFTYTFSKFGDLTIPADGLDEAAIAAKLK